MPRIHHPQHTGPMPSADSTSWRVPVGAQETSALYQEGAGGRGVLFVCAHGAGGNMRDRGMDQVAAMMRARGVSILRFNFLYKEKGSGRPDPMPLLEETVDAVVQRARSELAPQKLIIGGRSMGGRAASMLASRGYDSDGLLLLAYPLHPAGRPEKLRDAHLPDIAQQPVLCLNGTRDPLCDPELMKNVLQRVGPNWRMHWLEGADHSFHVPKSSGRDDAAVMQEAGDAVDGWLREMVM
jgi:uncharacterized protein